jgi:phosphatidylglycerol---prolipoprotein diacylglyceryl transferase
MNGSAIVAAMHFPVDLHVAGHTISSHFLLNTIAYSVAARYYVILSHRAGEAFSKDRLEILAAGALGGMLGARILDMLDASEFEAIRHVGLVYYFFLGGKTIAGAIMGGIVGIEFMKWMRRQKRSTGDRIVFPLILGIIVGRIGCFLTGVTDETAGLPSALPWAFDQGDGIPRHPTSLYEILFLLCVWVALFLARKKVPKDQGMLFRYFALAYFLFRVFVDSLKPGVPLAFGLTAIQLACALGALWYTFDIYRKRANGPRLQSILTRIS